MLGLNDDEYGDTVLRNMPNNEFCGKEAVWMPMMGGSVVTTQYQVSAAYGLPGGKSVQDTVRISNADSKGGRDQFYQRQLSHFNKQSKYRKHTANMKLQSNYKDTVVVSEYSENFFA